VKQREVVKSIPDLDGGMGSLPHVDTSVELVKELSVL